MYAIVKFDKELSEKFPECLYVRSLALRLIYTVDNLFAFSPFLVCCFVCSASSFFIQGSLIKIFCVILYLALKNMKV